jgi:hypothetical protein
MPELTACTGNRIVELLVPEHLGGSAESGEKGADAREGFADIHQDLLNQGPIKRFWWNLLILVLTMTTQTQTVHSSECVLVSTIVAAISRSQ